MNKIINEKLVSIIILSYKNLEYINETIKSVLLQDYEDIELIIADDGTENFDVEFYKDYIDINKSYNIKNIIIYSNEQNLGTTKNANKAISLSNGKYIKFIGNDDYFYERESISRMVNYMKANNSLILSTNILWCDIDMNELDQAQKLIKEHRQRMKDCRIPSKLFKQLAKGRNIAPGIMFNRELIHKFELFDEDYVLLEDWPTWLRLARNGIKFDYLDIISVKYRTGSGISTTKKINAVLHTDLRNCIEKEILPYKKELGNLLYKRIYYRFVRGYKFTEYSLIKKIIFLLFNIDTIVINQMKKLKLKLNRGNTNEN